MEGLLTRPLVISKKSYNDSGVLIRVPLIKFLLQIYKSFHIIHLDNQLYKIPCMNHVDVLTRMHSRSCVWCTLEWAFHGFVFVFLFIILLIFFVLILNHIHIDCQEGRPIQQTSALDLLLSGVKGKVVCKGPIVVIRSSINPLNC